MACCVYCDGDAQTTSSGHPSCLSCAREQERLRALPATRPPVEPIDPAPVARLYVPPTMTENLCSFAVIAACVAVIINCLI